MEQAEKKRKGPAPYASERKLVTVTLRILPAEIAAIKEQAAREGITDGEWKRRAIRDALGAKP